MSGAGRVVAGRYLGDTAPSIRVQWERTNVSDRTPGQAAYEAGGAAFRDKYGPACDWDRLDADIQAAWEAAANAAIDWWHADRDLEAPRGLIAERDSVAGHIAELRVLLSMLADRAVESGAITEGEADEWRQRGGVAP